MTDNLQGYEFIQAVGKGKTGSVYLARQTALNRFVAIKQVLGAWNGNRQELERLRREAQAMARMNHPNVVEMYSLEAAGSDLYLIQEYVHGPSLRAIMASKRLTIGQAMRVIGEVSAALEYASKMGILHRALNPGKITVTTSGVCKLGDFGLVNLISDHGELGTGARTALGTPSYLSPEQAAGKAEIDQRADVYSLAVISYELLAGRLPFVPMPSPPGHASSGFPTRVEAVLLAGLADDPKNRPQSAGEFWVKLADAGQKSWPEWAGQSDLAALAADLAPPAPADMAPDPSATPPPHLDPVRWTLSPLDTMALMAGSEPMVRPVTRSDDTVALAAQADEPMVMRPAGDDRVVHGATAGDKTAVQPSQSIHAGQPSGAPAFVPPPAGSRPAPAPLPGLPAFAVPDVQVPVYKASQGRSFAARLVRILILLLILAILAVLYWYFLRRA